MFDMLIECENCGCKFLAASTIDRRDFCIDDKTISLTFYDCKSCGTRHFVQADTKETLQELERVKQEMRKCMENKRKGKKNKKQSDKFKKAREHLAKSRNKLMNEFTGKTAVQVETGESFVLGFSV